MFFCYKDSHIGLMHDFLKGYHTNSKQDQMSEASTYISLKKSESLVSTHEKNKITQADKLNDKLAALKQNFEKIQQIQQKIEEEES